MRYRYDEFNKNDFESHKLALNFVAPHTRVLDVGCATGYLARELKKKGCVVDGVDFDAEALKKAKKYCSKCVRVDLNLIKTLPFPKKEYDYILLLDVVEHLVSPERLLKLVKPHLRKNGKIIVSVPNISHASVRWQIWQGKFAYEETGILDKTHLHFFTKKILSDLLQTTGWKVERVLPTNGMCKVPLLRKITDRLPKNWQYLIACSKPELFAYQFVAVARIG